MKWSVQRALAVRQVTSVRMSPDGRRVAFGVGQVVNEGGKNVFKETISIIDVDGTDHVTPVASGVTNPQWAPDSSRIAYVRNHDGKQDVWVTALHECAPVAVTNVRFGVSSYKWSPDGKWIAYTSAEPPSSEQEESRHSTEMGRIVGKSDVDMHRLYVVALGDGAKKEGRRVVAEDYNIGVGVYPGLYDWAPDSRSIAFTHSDSPRPSDWATANVSLVNITTGHIETLTERAEPTLEPLFSPNGQWMVYSVFDLPDVTNDLSFHVMNVSTKEVRMLPDTFDRRPLIIGWRADSNGILYTEWKGTRRQLRFLPIDGTPSALVTESGSIGSVSLDGIGRRIAFSRTELSSAPEVCVCSADGSDLRQVTEVNEDASDYDFGRTEALRWNSPEGVSIEGLVTYPVDYQQGRRYPVVLVAHGGPEGVFSASFVGSSSIYGQVATLASLGYVVLRPNVRGSTGYGPEHRHANYQDWGGGDFRDLMSGLDYLIDAGIGDGSRVGIIGWSFGGYLAAWASTQTSRFRAVVVGAGITDLVSNAGTCDIPSNIPGHFGGEVWQQRDLLVERSPVLQLRYSKTPTLILHGDDDRRVPISQSHELRNCLVRQGGEVEMVVYEGMGHVPSNPEQMRDVMTRTVDWIHSHV